MITKLKQFWQDNRRKPKMLPLTIILVTVLLIIFFKSIQPQPPVKKQEEASWTVQTQQLANGAKSPQLELYGRVESPHTATLSAIIDADVRTLEVHEGETVLNEQLLIMLDETEARLAYDEKSSAVAELEAQIQLEKNRYKNDLAALKLEKSLVALEEKKLQREEKTSKNNLTSQSSFDTQKVALNSQKLALNARQLNVTNHPARLTQLEANLARQQALAQKSRNDLTRTAVLAPFDGIILKTMASPGERVRPGEALLEMYATDHVELRAQLPNKFIDIVKQSLQEQVPLYAIVYTVSGDISVTLDRISGSIDSGSQGVDALFSVNSEQADRLTIGDTMKLVLQLPAIPDVYSVPVSSIYGTNRIYRAVDGRLAAVTVEKLGGQFKHGRQFILVRSDQLDAGDQVIITQLPHALSGLKVEVRNTTEPPAAAKPIPEDQTDAQVL